MEPQDLRRIYEAITGASADTEQVSRMTGLSIADVQVGIDLLIEKNLIVVANAADLRYKTK